MALVRLPCSSSSLFLRSNQQNLVFISPLSCPQNPSYSNNGDIKLSLSRSSSSLFSTSLGHNPLTSIRAKRTRKFVFQLASTSQDDAVASSSSDAEEFSRNRLLAQNVPWNSTPEDIRSLFEKYGTVVDVEVCNFSLFLLPFLFDAFGLLRIYDRSFSLSFQCITRSEIGAWRL